ncbi:MAG: hypothetical protein ACLQGN_28740 [Mycobacterium sp.]|uniref:hypothetical protein n=1 Tax=Mycobacterium sp. TaxID=1785 RepID=UPI003F9A312C
MITTYLTIAGMLAFVLSPALIPVTVHAIHAVRHWHPTWAPARTAGYQRRNSPSRLAVAAA